MEIKVSIEDLKPIEEIKPKHREALKIGLLKAGQEMTSKIRANTPVGVTGLAKSSVQINPATISSEYIISSLGCKYYPIIEEGSKPHFPPVEALYDWVSKKLHITGLGTKKVAWAIAVTISKRGTQGKKVFENVYNEYKEKVPSIVKRYVDMVK